MTSDAPRNGRISTKCEQFRSFFLFFFAELSDFQFFLLKSYWDHGGLRTLKSRFHISPSFSMFSDNIWDGNSYKNVWKRGLNKVLHLPRSKYRQKKWKMMEICKITRTSRYCSFLCQSLKVTQVWLLGYFCLKLGYF